MGQGVNPLPKSLSLRMSYAIWCYHSEWLKDTVHQASPLAVDKVPPADSSSSWLSSCCLEGPDCLLEGEQSAPDMPPESSAACRDCGRAVP